MYQTLSNGAVRDFTPPLQATDIAYLAGLIDGEGAIMRMSPTGGKGWRVRVQMNDKEVIDWLSQFGGRVYFREREAPRKNAWLWEVNRKESVRLLLATILPFLKIHTKIARAKEALTSYHPRLHSEEEVGAFGVVTVVETRTCPMCEGSGRVPDVE